MTKSKTGTATARKKRGAVPTSIDDYLADISEPARSKLEKLRAAIQSAAPEATEIISYRMPAFRQKKILVWFAAFTNHCSLFPTSGMIHRFKDELKSFPTTKGSVHFDYDKPLPIVLIKKIVKARLAHVKNS
jgi:uncharacterized protein YdhG (YjbR/CyaY superfamily)